MFKLMYVSGLIRMFITCLTYRWRARNNKIVVSRTTTLESVLLAVAFVGMICIPLPYVFTSLLNFANYHLPPWVGWIGIVTFLASLWLRWCSHTDLGRNWSETLELRHGHSLVTTGVYTYVRHPMYAAFLLWGFAQPVVLHNWIAGFSHIVSFFVLYYLRVPHEEQMMHEQFGEAYQAYAKRTGSVISHLF